MARIATLFALMALSTQAVASDYSGEPERPEVTLAGMTFEVRTLPPGTQPVRKPPPPTSPHIRVLQPDYYEIDRVLVNKYAYNVNALMKLAWVCPHKDAAGRTDGYRIGGIGAGNILYQGGMRSGDVVMSVNGRATRNMAQVFLAHSQLRFRDTFEVLIMRRGRAMVLNYSIVR